jgi:hypothetical protein
MLRSALIIAGAALALRMTAAHAEESATPSYSFSGFGTLGLVHSNEHLADFTANFFQARGAGFSDNWSPGVDSRVGVQLSAQFTSSLSAVVQAISEQRYDKTYRPGIEWANLKYQVTPNFSVRLGRTVLPTFAASDILKVGYANPWVRPPREVYALLPISNSDGVDFTYSSSLGNATNTLRGTYGQNSAKVPAQSAGGSIDAKHMLVVSDSLSYRALTVRASYQSARLMQASINPFFELFSLFGPEGVAIADQYNGTDKSYVTETVGASYEPGRWFMSGEWGRTRSTLVFGNSIAWYLSGGYRVRQFTPYFVLAEGRANEFFSRGLTLSALPPNVAAQAAGLNAALAVILQSIEVQKSTSLGVRWDFRSNFDFKLQYDHVQHGAGSAGTLTNIQPGFQAGGAYDLLSATVDFVF